MTDILKAVRDGIMGALLGKTPEQWADEQRQQDVVNAVDRFLESNPEWKPTAKATQAVTPVKDTKKKAIRIKKNLIAGAGGFQERVISPELLERARQAARAFQSADPDRYSDIITTASIS